MAALFLLELAALEVQAVYRYATGDAVRIYGIGPVVTDFAYAIWRPARNVLHGAPPYADPHSEAFDALAVFPVYPPSGFLPALPLAAMPLEIATAIFIVLLTAAAIVTLRALDVTDWRCHAVWLLTPLTLIPVITGNASVFVVLCVALLWRYRDRPYAGAAALVAAIAIKPFIAPLWIWLVMTRRYKAAVVAACATPLVLLSSWALIGFSGLRDYPAILDRAAERWSADGFFVQALVLQLGYGRTIAVAVAIGVGATLIIIASRTDTLTSFTLICAAAVVISPIGWHFYAAFLVVPLAVRHPNFGLLWIALAIFWLTSWWYTPLDDKSVELSVVVNMLIAAAFTFAALRSPSNFEADRSLSGGVSSQWKAVVELPLAVALGALLIYLSRHAL